MLRCNSRLRWKDKCHHLYMSTLSTIQEGICRCSKMGSTTSLSVTSPKNAIQTTYLCVSLEIPHRTRVSPLKRMV